MDKVWTVQTFVTDNKGGHYELDSIWKTEEKAKARQAEIAIEYDEKSLVHEIVVE